MSESHAQRAIFPSECPREGSMYTHTGLMVRDIGGHRYHSVKRSRIENGSFPSSDVFSSSGIIQAPVFHSPITSTIAASLPTQSESTFSSKSQCLLRCSPCCFRFLCMVDLKAHILNITWITKCKPILFV